ncbi:CMP/dCMP deaminase zinc-binding protein [Thermodesulfobium narugense DSM 14796]|uniref:Cytidine deaminase n=1 Tax=Thermodesulfobium narugense DSM 14796 TaxID=747365 RepID=M1E8R4_9BACT|nr:cytidine deaminase [Thermodesulfobium narugense]AEE15110.1 CMP/dCMP deaminase zinc-binding protein [Thermodesulfobium narugense DSM 14796]
MDIEKEVNLLLDSKNRIDKNLIEKLIDEAKNASMYSYSPYSKFAVGASLLLKSRNIVQGCNIENSSYGSTMCAERVAFFKAISYGERSFLCLAVYNKNILPYPCGCCLQVMSEFVDSKFPIILISDKERRIMSFSDLLRHPFSLYK